MKEEIARMQAYIEKFPSDMKEAFEIGSKAVKSFDTKKVDRVLIIGLGGSGIGGRICQNLVFDSCSTPISLVNNYDLPAWVNSTTLVIAVSYSGNTEETLNAYNQATEKGCQIACITSGGSLAEKAKIDGANIVLIPGGQPPRTSFGYNASQLFFILEAYGLLSQNFSGMLKPVAEILEQKSESIRTKASQIAKGLADKLPVVYAPSNLEGVAIRLRQQINENAKMLCWHHVLPEMNHNELVGWADEHLNIGVIFLYSDRDHPKVETRRKLTRDILKKKVNACFEIQAQGDTAMEQAYYLIHLGDWISFYLAEIRDVDPIEIDVIDYLKSELAK